MAINTIFSERLELRPVRMSDADTLAEFYTDAETIKYIPWPLRSSEEINQAVELATTRNVFEKEGDYLVLAVIVHDDQRLIGQVNVMYRSEINRIAEFGYVLNPKFTRQGYATEAAKALIAKIFSTGRFHRIEARLDDRNLRSKALLERIGLRLEAHFLENYFFKGEWTSTFVYAILQSQWDNTLTR